MGTNFYLLSPPCASCGHVKFTFHIGQSAVGWKFLLQAYPQNKLETWREWKAFLIDSCGNLKFHIEDEYGHPHSVEEMIQWIEKRQSGGDRDVGEDHYRDAEGYWLSPADFS